MYKIPLAKTFFAALLGVGMCKPFLHAANDFHAPGDLILFFQKEGGNDTVYVGLGSAANLYRGSAAGPTGDRQKLNIININSELATAFGAGWASDPSIYSGLCAARSSSTGTGVFDGDQTRTLYASRPRQSVGTLGQPDSQTWDLTLALPFTTSSTQMIAMANTFEVNYTTQAAVSPKSLSTIDNQNPFLAPGIQDVAFGGFSGGVQQVGSATPIGVFGPAGQVEFALDLYRIVPRADSETTGEVSGVKNIGSYEGTVVVGTDGNVSFITVQAEITVEQPEGSGLADNGPEVDFGSEVIGNTTASRTFTIKNTGTADLTGLSLSATGNTTDFVIGSLPVITLVPGDKTSFTVAFKPTALGKRSAALQIASSDADEAVFDIPLGGTGTSTAAPEIAVEGPSGGGLTDNASSVGFETQQVGTTGTARTFIIRNSGSANLTNLAVTAGGVNAGDFIVVSPAVTFLAPGDFTNFTVAFRPTAGGPRSATLQVASNDADENPFDIGLSGTGTIPAIPEIAVEQPEGTPLADNASLVGFGNQTINTTSATKSFSIRNTGNADLTGLALSVTGSAGDFVIGALSANSLAQGAFATFTVAFRPTVEGLRGATLQIASNDADESPFDIPLSGNGTAVPTPEIAVEQPEGTGLTDNASTVDFGNQDTGTISGLKTFTIRNPGNSSLTGLAVTAIGGNPGDFVLGALSADTVAPGDSATFTVAFMPAAAGIRTATLQIASNDADENPFDIPLSGTGVIPPPLPQPEIAVKDSSAADLLDGTRIMFGVAASGASANSKTFTIKNTGEGNLTGISLSKTGRHPGDFQVTRPAKNVLAPGASTTFTVTFKPVTNAKPAASDYRSAEIRIASNDVDENPFNMTVGGCACQPSPEIVVEQPARSKLADGRSKISFGTVKADGTTGRSKTFTIRNTGTANLVGIGVSISGDHAKDFTVSKAEETKLSPESSTTFKVTFKPSASGLRSATLSIKSNDKDENPFDIRLSGQGAR